MGLKSGAVFAHLQQFGQGEDLEAAAVGQDRAGPVHKPVQPAKRFDDLAAGPQVQVIGIAENDLGAGLEEILRRQGLDRPQGSHRHEHGGFDFTMGGLKSAAAGGGFGGLGTQFKGERHGLLSGPGIGFDLRRSACRRRS